MNELTTLNIKSKIITLRGVQVMIDRDLAQLYDIETRALKQAVNRNKKRFPEDFMFILNEEDINFLVSQSVIPSKKHLGGANPYVFTEQGVSNLASILSSDKAIDINIYIMRAFVAMRKFISQNASIFQRLDRVELKQLEHDQKFDKVFKALETNEKKQGIFYDGQVFDAYTFVCDLVKNAKKEIVLIDNYVDESVLILFSKRKKGIFVKIYTKNISKQLKLDIEKFNSQYESITVKEFNNAHDRFMIIDSKEVYHFGASLKDIGKKWFAFSKFEKEALLMLNKLNEVK